MFVTKWGTKGNGAGQFSLAEGIAVDNLGYVYVADVWNQRIQKFDSNGAYLLQWGTYGVGDGQFQNPRAVAVGASGMVYTTEAGQPGLGEVNNRVQEFTPDGAFITKWGRELFGPGSGDGEFKTPIGIAVGPNGDVYVADIDNNRVQHFDANGVFLGKWGAYPYSPRAIACDMQGNVYVADDTYPNRLEKFDANGQFILQWGSWGSGDGQFFHALGVACDLQGNVYVTDNGNNRIEKFDGNGTLLTKWGTYGSGDGEFYYPLSIAVDHAGNVYVGEAGNYRIQVFAPAPVKAVSTTWGRIKGAWR